MSETGALNRLLADRDHFSIRVHRMEEAIRSFLEYHDLTQARGGLPCDCRHCVAFRRALGGTGSMMTTDWAALGTGQNDIEGVRVYVQAHGDGISRALLAEVDRLMAEQQRAQRIEAALRAAVSSWRAVPRRFGAAEPAWVQQGRDALETGGGI